MQLQSPRQDSAAGLAEFKLSEHSLVCSKLDKIPVDRQLHCLMECFLLYAGVLGIVWGIGWFFTAYDSPATHPRISVDEREYIETALNTKAGQKVCKGSLALKFCI